MASLVRRPSKPNSKTQLNVIKADDVIGGSSAAQVSSAKKRTIARMLVLVLIGIAILALFGVIKAEVDRMLLAEKVTEKQFQIDLITKQIDHFIEADADWISRNDYYVNTILTGIEMLDASYMTYAALFDSSLQNLSARSPSYEGSPFEPTTFEEFVHATATSETGDLVLPFTPPGGDLRDMHLHYQWLPSDKALENRVLAVVAISHYSVNNSLAVWIQVTAVAFVAVAIIVAIAVWRRQMTETLNKTLEETVLQRTVELEEQTASAKKASMVKSEFLSNMSHEMRTPMNAIIGMTAIAKNSGDITRKDYCLKKIEDASTHLLSVINDILDMSKIEANKFELSIEKFNLERVLQKVTDVILFRVEEKHQNFTVHIDKNLPLFLMGDDQRVTQVIANLLSNAVKFTPEGGTIQLNAYLQERTDNICTIKIEVSDTGIGISPEQQQRLFSSFVQAESNTTRKFGGTGLGLAISKHIVEMMGGEIWIESELGKGSTFAFTMKAESSAGESGNLLEQGVNWGNMSVLVVDDSPDTRDCFVDIMQRFGSECDVAASGEEACARISEHGPYDFYFIGWRMPGMDGVELAKRINLTKDSKSVIIMVSASGWDEIEDSAKDAGINRFLPKPLFPSNIADCINECLGSDNATRGTHEMNYIGIFKGRRIILAEDVEVNREIVFSLLEPTELIIDAAENGREAFELFQRNPDSYDMIFMDVQMPEMDGYEATMKIRALDLQKAKGIPIVAMTANVFKDDIEKCISSGMTDHLGKPINYEKMIYKLCTYLLKW